MSVNQLIGTALTVRQLFTGHKYRLEYYQREYTWNKSSVTELLDDLISRFLSLYEETHDQKEVNNYRSYFLGPIVTNPTDGYSSLVDGQQRLTTLMLLLIHLNRFTEGIDGAENLEPLVYSTRFGEKTFNIDVPEREEVMKAILKRESFDAKDKLEAVRKIWERSEDIFDVMATFAEELKRERLVLFVDWLLEKVVLVEIKTIDQDMALEAFETMNDRGMQLSNTDMLKSYLLSKIGDKQHIDEANQLWRERMTELNELYKNAGADFWKVWLRGAYANTIRERKKGASPGDFDIIGTAFHRWVRDNHKNIGLHRAEDYRRFINTDFKIMSSRWKQYVEACWQLKPGLEHIFYNNKIGIHIQDLPIMAAVTPDDDEDTFILKASLVASYLDLFVARRIVNYQNYGYSTIVYRIFNLAKDIRNLDPDSLRDNLRQRVSDLPSFDGMKHFGLYYRGDKRIRYLLARMTSWIEQECGEENRFAEYVDRYRRDPYEIEHIWANKFEAHRKEFDNEHDFGNHRNKFGGLLLLPKSVNQCLGAKPYEEKLECYSKQNLLVKSLHDQAYRDGSKFSAFANDAGLPFKPYPDGFSKEDINERQELYRQICEQVWDPDRLLAIEPDAAGGNSSSTQTS